MAVINRTKAVRLGSWTEAELAVALAVVCSAKENSGFARAGERRRSGMAERVRRAAGRSPLQDGQHAARSGRAERVADTWRQSSVAGRHCAGLNFSFQFPLNRLTATLRRVGTANSLLKSEIRKDKSCRSIVGLQILFRNQQLTLDRSRVKSSQS